MHGVSRAFTALSILLLAIGILLPLLFTGIGTPPRIPTTTSRPSQYIPSTSIVINTNTGSNTGGATTISGGPSSSSQDYGLSTLASILQSYARRLDSLKAISRVWGITLADGLVLPAGVKAIQAFSENKEPSYSQTNVQVEGVDEEDVVKNNDRYIFIGLGGEVKIFDTLVKEVIYRIILPEAYSVSGLYLDGDYLVIIAGKPYVSTPIVIGYTWIPVNLGSTLVAVYNVSNPHSPVEVKSSIVSGVFKGSRLLNHVAYVITISSAYTISENSSLVPVLPSVSGGVTGIAIIPSKLIAPLYTVTIYSVNLEDMREEYTVMLSDYVDWIYMSHERLYIASRYPLYRVLDLLFPELLVNATLKLGILPDEVSRVIEAHAVKGEYGLAYTVIAEYLNSLSEDEALKFMNEVNAFISNTMPGLKDTTVFHVIDVNGTSLKYKGSIEVEGLILDQFAMEEMSVHGASYFVTATTVTQSSIKFEYDRYTTSPVSSSTSVIPITICSRDGCFKEEITIEVVNPAQPAIAWRLWYGIQESSTYNTVSVVNLDNMSVIATLDNIAPGERIYAARLVKTILYVVTYRNVDPLYAIDLSDPEKPRILGYLKVPGFSEYLHPVGNDLLLGVGLNDSWELKISLFNVSNPVEPCEESYIKLPGWSRVLVEHHAFTWDPSYNRAYIPFSYTSDGVLVVGITDSSLKLVSLLPHQGVIRVIYINGSVYTISPSSIKEWNRDSLGLLKEYEL